MSLVTKKRSRVPGSSKLIAVMTLHMDRAAAQEAALNKGSHAPCCMPELIVMPYGYLSLAVVGERDQSSSVLLVECEGLLHIDVTSPFETKLRNIVMGFGRRCYVNDSWSRFIQHFFHISKIPFNL